MDTYPATSLGDWGRLLSSAAGAALRHPRAFDMSLVLHDWMRDLTVRHGANVFFALAGKRMLLVTEPELSRHILDSYPISTGYTAGTPKRKAMSYLAPEALTLADGQPWARLRSFNERVLCAGRPHDHQKLFLDHVHRAFSTPLSSVREIRSRMGQAMLDIVFGKGVAPAGLAADIEVLFGLVQSPVKRFLRGGRERRRVEALYDSVREAWQRSHGSTGGSLIGVAREAAGSENLETLLQQVPHWMFTFSGSGSDMLIQGLAMIGSRPEALSRVQQELAKAGPLGQPASIDGLRYLRACLLEATRLFPPVKRTFHRAPAGDVVKNSRIPPGTEILQIFSLTQRDGGSDPTADTFQPDRWLRPSPNAEAVYPNLFLSGARACPGRNLILFVCKAAAATVLHESGTILQAEELARDPVPFSFPSKRVALATVPVRLA